MSDAGEPVLRAIDILAPALEGTALDEVEVEAGGLLVRLARHRPLTAAATLPHAGTAAQDAAPSAPSAPVAPASPYGEPAGGMRFVTAPLTGVWYAAPSPGARPYITDGAEIGAGTVIGLIEAMKLFNEIKSDTAGRVTRILVESGTLVKRQQPLIEVDPSA